VTALALVKSDEWHAERRTGIGASDVPAIAGMSSFATPIDVWQQKVGRVEPNPETPMTRWGTLLEPVIADEFAAVTGRKLRRVERALRYRDWPILFAHLDRRVEGGGVLECKKSMSTRGWGETGSADVPPHVALQVQTQLACADQETGFVAALLGYSDFRWFEIPRDRDLFEDAILPLLRQFWRQVETETPPEPDGSESYGAFLRRTYATDTGETRTATPEETLIAAELIEVRAAKEAAAIKDDELTQRLQDAMRDTSRLDGPGWHITWRQSKPRVITDWKAIAGALLPSDDTAREHIIRGATEQKPGNRPFLLKLSEGDES
jgi:putative phage-type endonuclease